MSLNYKKINVCRMCLIVQNGNAAVGTDVCPFCKDKVLDICSDESKQCPKKSHDNLSDSLLNPTYIQNTAQQLSETEIANYFKICEQCSESTYDDLHADEITEWSKTVSGWITKIGNAINDKTKYLRCKRCGCFCKAKGKYGSILQRMSLGIINGQCPVKWDDGKSNWEHGEPLNKK